MRPVRAPGLHCAANAGGEDWSRDKIIMSILLDYYRLPPAEREKVLHDQTTWDQFKNQLLTTQSKAMQDAVAKVNVDGLSREERFAKLNAAIKQSRNPRLFDLEKDWHILAYLFTG